MTDQWHCVLALDENRRPDSGSTEELARAIRAGADLRVGTAFRHNEHIDPSSESDELIREVMDFRITYLIEDRWVAGIENMRMPVSLPDGFGPRESMSFFLYNQDGHQAIARPFLDERQAMGQPGRSPINDWRDMPKYQYAVKVGDFQWVRNPPGQSVARPEATRAAEDSRKVSSTQPFCASAE